jgi:hypothetical protein
MTPKQEILEVVRRLPDDASRELVTDILSGYVDSRRLPTPEEEFTPEEVAQIESALDEARADIAAGRFKTQEQVEHLFREQAKGWNTK